MQNKEIDSSKIKILVCCHKKCDLPQADYFLPVYVGAAITVKDFVMQRDDQLNGEPCDNISDKNKNYCELTAMYWAWKNIKKLYPDLEYIGLNHYRRYFKFSKIFSRIAKFKADSEASTYVLNKNKIQKLLNRKNIIIAESNIYPYSLAVDYSVAHISEDLRTLMKIVHDMYPDYDEIMYDFFYKNNKLSHYNMFIATWQFFDEYCTWLFSILFEAERRLDISNYSDIQKRIWGYMAERLFNVYLIYNKSKIKPYPVYIYNNRKESFFHYFINRIRYSIGFNISKRVN